MLRLHDISKQQKKEQLYREWENSVYKPVTKALQRRVDKLVSNKEMLEPSYPVSSSFLLPGRYMSSEPYFLLCLSFSDFYHCPCPIQGSETIERSNRSEYSKFLEVSNSKPSGLYLDVVGTEEYDPFRRSNSRIRLTTSKLHDPAKRSLLKALEEKEMSESPGKSGSNSLAALKSRSRDVFDTKMWGTGKIETTTIGERQGRGITIDLLLLFPSSLLSLPLLHLCLLLLPLMVFLLHLPSSLSSSFLCSVPGRYSEERDKKLLARARSAPGGMKGAARSQVHLDHFTRLGPEAAAEEVPIGKRCPPSSSYNPLTHHEFRIPKGSKPRYPTNQKRR